MKGKTDWLLIWLLTAGHLAMVATEVTNALRVVTGFLLTGLLPGYALLAAFYRPYRSRFHPLEQIGLAIPISLASSTAIGLLLNLFNLGLSARPQAFCLGALILGCSLCRPRPTALEVVSPSARLLVLSAFSLAAAILVVLPAPRELPAETQFLSLYVLDESGTTGAYPRTVKAGEVVDFVVGGAYRGSQPLQVRLALGDSDRRDILDLRPGERWERPYAVKLAEPGRFPLVWSLEPGDGGPPLRTVRIWLNVQ